LITILCCLRNEISRAPRVFEKLLSWAGNHASQHYFEFLLVDNFSNDGTREWIKSLRVPQTSQLKICLNDRDLGKGGSIKAGLELAAGDIVVIFDLDGEYCSDDIATGLNLIVNSSTDLVLGSRTLGGGGDYLYFTNFLGVKLLTFLINILYNSSISDSATGLKFLRRDFFNGQLKYSGFNVDFEIVCLALKRGGAVAQFRAGYVPRSKMQGKKINALRDGLSSLWVILRTRFRS
jgi:glycosyltransferase involved in cell wall biosynthesis